MQLAGWGMSTISAVSIPSCAALASHADSSVLSAATVCVRRPRDGVADRCWLTLDRRDADRRAELDDVAAHGDLLVARGRLPEHDVGTLNTVTARVSEQPRAHEC